MIIKVCGMKDAQNIREVESAGPDWMGFIFHKSSARYAGECPPDYLPRCTRVGVFVDKDLSEITHRIASWGLNAVQLHGSEAPSLCRAIKERGCMVIKVFSIGIDGIPANIHQYDGACDYFLFDTACPCRGGSGKRFDWSVLDSYQGPTPFILSGGIAPEHLEEIQDLAHPMLAGIDLNSGFEIKPGLKDSEKLHNFIEALRQ